MSIPHRPFNMPPLGTPPTRTCSAICSRMGPLLGGTKCATMLGLAFAICTDVWRLVEIASAYLFLDESGFGHSCERVQFAAVCGQHVGRDHGDAGRIETARDACTRHTAAAKPRFHRSIEALLKRLDIVVIAFEPDVGNVFRVPELIFREGCAGHTHDEAGKHTKNLADNRWSHR